MRDWDRELREAAQRVADAVIDSEVFESSKASPTKWSTRLADESRKLLMALGGVKGKPTAVEVMRWLKRKADVMDDDPRDICLNLLAKNEEGDTLRGLRRDEVIGIHVEVGGNEGCGVNRLSRAKCYRCGKPIDGTPTVVTAPPGGAQDYHFECAKARMAECASEGCGHCAGEKSSIGLQGLSETFTAKLPRGVSREDALRESESLNTQVPAMKDDRE